MIYELYHEVIGTRSTGYRFAKTIARRKLPTTQFQTVASTDSSVKFRKLQIALRIQRTTQPPYL